MGSSGNAQHECIIGNSDHAFGYHSNCPQRFAPASDIIPLSADLAIDHPTAKAADTPYIDVNSTLKY